MLQEILNGFNVKLTITIENALDNIPGHPITVLSLQTPCLCQTEYTHPGKLAVSSFDVPDNNDFTN